MKLHYLYYNEYPKNVCADAGYGSLDNYKFLSNNNIGNYGKYFSWEGNISGRYPSKYIINEDNSITCLNEKIFEVVTELQQFIKQAESNLLSVQGLELKVNRSSQVEGAYGVLNKI